MDARDGRSSPLATLDAFTRRMGWRVKWVSSLGSDLNHDFHVTFTEDERRGEVDDNYQMRQWGSPEAPGASVFYRDQDARCLTPVRVARVDWTR